MFKIKVINNIIQLISILEKTYYDTEFYINNLGLGIIIL